MYRAYSGGMSLSITLGYSRIMSAWIKYRALYSDFKEQTTYCFDAYIC